MRVGIVTGSFTPRLGGAVTHTKLICKLLREKGHSSAVFCPDLEKEGCYAEGDLTVHRFRVPSFNSRAQVILKLRNAVSRARDQFDVFVSPEFNSGALAMAFVRGIRSLGIYGADMAFEALNLHRKIPVPYERVLSMGGPLFWVQRFLFRRLGHTLALNRFDEARIRRVTTRCSCVGLWTDAPMQPRQVPAAPRLATITGRKVCWKGIGQAYYVARQIQAVFPAMEIRYYGDRPMNRPGMVDFVGKSNHEVSQALLESDITVNMSEYETYCFGNLEAMAAGSLLVVKPLPQYDYLTDQNSVLSDFAPAAIGAFRSGRVSDMLQEAQRTVVAEADNAEKFLRLLEQLVQGRPPR